MLRNKNYECLKIFQLPTSHVDRTHFLGIYNTGERRNVLMI